MNLATLMAIEHLDTEFPNVGLEGGLQWALIFTDALTPRMVGTKAHITVSAWSSTQTSGLFLHDEVRSKAVRVGRNTSAGCGRLIWGSSDDFAFPSRDPKDSIFDTNVLDFDVDELADAVAFACEFFTE
jgi:hypothetical protein